MSRQSLINQYIDHTILKPDATEQQVKKLCEEANTFAFKAACVPPSYLCLASQILTDSKVNVCTVIGFPLGYNTTTIKVAETKEAIQSGADEIDMVINISQAKSQQWDYVTQDILQVLEACEQENKTLKIIIETALLSLQEKETVLHLCNKLLIQSNNTHFVKTSTGFSHTGATLEDITMMRSILNKKIHIKASGGIKTRNFALELIKAGANRLGTSSGITLVT